MLSQQQQKAMKLFDVVVVGGGLSGVTVGNGLQKLSQQSLDWKLLEARPVLGGRLANNNNNAGKIDMGGAWIWPFQQPYMKSLVRELNLSTFTQPDDPSSTRIEGGAVEIVHSLASSFEKEGRVELGTAVKACTLVEDTNSGSSNEQQLIRLDTVNDQSFLARRVVFAVPPRLLHKHVTFDPPLSKAKQAALASSHTWMAAVTKVALEYSTRFWDLEVSNMGLPQQHGPAFQVYDSSTADESTTALTFFTVVKPENEEAATDDAALAKQVANQMAQVWTYFRQPELAKQAHSYTNHYVHRWPKETYISEDDSPSTVHPHPSPVRALSEPEWGGLLEFAGTETDRGSPGVMEGAVGAAKRVLQSLQQTFVKSLSPDRPSTILLQNNTCDPAKQEQPQVA